MLCCVVGAIGAGLGGRWASLDRWGRDSFQLHLLCEWGCGHFMHERYGYPIFKPQDQLGKLAPAMLSLGAGMPTPPLPSGGVVG